MLQRSEDVNKEIVRQIKTDKSRNDGEKMLFAPEFTAYISDATKLLNRKEHINALQLMHQAFQPLDFIIEDMITEDEKVAARVLVKEKHTRMNEHLLAIHNRVTFNGMIMSKGVEKWQIYDHLFMPKQMGLSVNYII